MLDPNDIRLNALARELEIKCRVLIDQLPKLGITEKKAHNSSLTLAQAEGVRAYFRSPQAPASRPMPTIRVTRQTAAFGAALSESPRANVGGAKRRKMGIMPCFVRVGCPASVSVTDNPANRTLFVCTILVTEAAMNWEFGVIILLVLWILWRLPAAGRREMLILKLQRQLHVIEAQLRGVPLNVVEQEWGDWLETAVLKREGAPWRTRMFGAWLDSVDDASTKTKASAWPRGASAGSGHLLRSIGPPKADHRQQPSRRNRLRKTCRQGVVVVMRFNVTPQTSR